MKTYGKPKKRICKIHSSDDCSICSNRRDKVVKARERKAGKTEITKGIEEGNILPTEEDIYLK